MSNNLSQGPTLIADLSIEGINQALLELQERQDASKGLRGRATVHDRLGVSDPSESGDAVSLGVIQAGTAFANITLLATGGMHLVALAPGTTYVELSANLRQQVNFASGQSIEARVLVQGWGTQSGTGKGVAITQSDGTVIAEVTWDGTTQGLKVGTFTAVTLTTDTEVQIRVKGSASTESLLLRGIGLDMRYAIDVLAI